MATEQPTGSGEAQQPATAPLGAEARHTDLPPPQTQGPLEQFVVLYDYDLSIPAQLVDALDVPEDSATVRYGRTAAWYEAENHRLELENQQFRLQRRTNEKTGLPNHIAFWEDFPTLVEQSIKDGHGIALIFCDVNGFKHVNDVYGYEAGDVLIQRVMTTIQGALRAGDAYVYHISGDECVIIVPDLPNTEDDEAVAVPVVGRHAVGGDWRRGTEKHTNPGRVMAVRQRVRDALFEKAFIGEFEGLDLDLATGAAISAGQVRRSAAQLFTEANADMHKDKDRIKEMLREQKPRWWRIVRALGDLADRLTDRHDARKR